MLIVREDVRIRVRYFQLMVNLWRITGSVLSSRRTLRLDAESILYVRPRYFQEP